MSNVYLPYLNDSNMALTSDVALTTLLSLPNETLDHIIQLLAGEPILDPLPQISRNEPVHTIRLVNRRLAALGSCYILFRHKCVSERQLKHETTHLTEEGKMRRRYTRQLELDNVPVLYWLSALQNLYPVVTHMSLINARFSSFTGRTQPTHGPYLVLASVKHLSIQVNNGNEEGIPNFLRSFPNLVTLLLDNDPAFYTGMSTKLILSFPPLPHLTTLYRPPLKQAHLTFSSDVGYTYTNTHEHPDFTFHELCKECLLWSRHSESSEQITVIQLAWLFPSLREVLIPRLVFEDWMHIVGLSSDESLPVFDGSGRTKGLDGIESMRRKSDVVVWLIDSVNHENCVSECPGIKQVNEVPPTEQVVATPLEALGDVGSSRPPFHVVRPRDYNDHIKFQKTRSTPIDDYPKFWWTSREKEAFFKAAFPSGRGDHIVPGNLEDIQEPVHEKDSSRAKIFGRWDL